MKNSKLLLLLLILPWITVPFLGMNNLKKFLPSAIFMVTLTKALDQFGEKKKWWRFYKGIGPLKSMNFFNFGPYLVTSLWVLKIAYGKFPLFSIITTIYHSLFTYMGLKYTKRYKIASLVNLGKAPYLGLLILRGLALYGFQVLTDLKPRGRF